MTTREPMLRLSEAAKELRVTSATIGRWIAERRIGCYRPSRRTVLIPRSEIDRLLDESSVSAIERRK
ncbi:MAG: helix-turn-helix domain-containing protein [Patescibacteria group bacterium]|nr:helix-turn-helix domain-containing protein [Patescibacteria group bacterium]